MATPINCLEKAGATDSFWDPSSSDGSYLDLGDYLLCAIPRLWGYAQIIFVAVAIILVMYLIYQTATNRENSSVLEELTKRWPYVILLAIVAIGGGGTILNIIIKFFGFSDVDFWLKGLDDFISRL
jgi:hypothetical protein